ncbi:WD40 repeat domain-containing protein [Micavibrio aeruginosavorus]|uniref:WD40 repeat domain-containing protein n=1 Tax=Micavibrio aeruginosavorus TaxID=349221 RepID=UPI00130E9C29|nr:hypothetical protein [Micavibrio aeruginosavorus]
MCAISFLSSAPALAACANPAGDAGHVVWDVYAYRPAYCNGANWVPFRKGLGADTLPTAHLRTINNPEPGDDDRFGQVMSISGDRVAVGAFIDDPGGIVNAGSAWVFDVKTGALLTTLNNPSPTASDQFGFEVSFSGDLVAVNAPYDDFSTYSDPGQVFVFNATTGAVVRTLQSPAPQDSARFGYGVSIDGDLIAVGEDGATVGGFAQAGRAHIFRVSTGALIRTINNPAPATSDRFGVRVSLSGDKVAIAAYLDDPGGVADAGTLYVYNINSGALVTTLNHPSPVANDQFGLGVSLDGDLVAVAAYFDDYSGMTDAGTAFVFNATTGALVSTLQSPNAAAGNNFGNGIQLRGTRVLAGSRFETVYGVSKAGAAYMFDALTGSVLAEYYPPNPMADDEFGARPAFSGKYAALGARWRDIGGYVDTGQLYIYGPDDSSWRTPVVAASFENPEPEAQDRFGHVTAVSGDIITIGARYDNPGGVADSGSIYVYNLKDSTQLHHITSPNPATGGAFGFALDSEERYLVVGAPLEAVGALNGAGRAYLYDMQQGRLLRSFQSPTPTAGAYFGEDVAISGNLMVVGEMHYDASGAVTDSGAAYVYNVETGALVATLLNPAPATSDRFGVRTDISGNVVIVGAYLDNPGGVTDSGTAYLFNATTGALLHTLSNPSPGTNDQFGLGVTIDGDYAVVGSMFNDYGGMIDAGSAHVFDVNSGAFLHALTSPNPAADDQFGNGLKLLGNVVAVGSRGDDSSGVTDSGAAYVFRVDTGALLGTMYSPTPTTGDLFGAQPFVSSRYVVLGAHYGAAGGVNEAGQLYVFTAQCANPAGGIGDIVYNNTDHVLQYCDGAAWRAAGPVGNGGAGCSAPAGTAGHLVYNSTHNVLQYCEGDRWVALSP